MDLKDPPVAGTMNEHEPSPGTPDDWGQREDPQGSREEQSTFHYKGSGIRKATDFSTAALGME